MPKPKPPIRKIEPFNPLDKENLGESVADEMLGQSVDPMPPDPFIGDGIYAIYYIGDFPLYAEVVEKNQNDRFQWPIYVGKAVPAGARKGGFGLNADPGQVLYKRLAEHAASIRQARNLKISDFQCRYLVVDDIWIPLAESLLIEMYHPLWNRKIDGFGNHDPGRGRYNQQKSPWDVLHPGRPWAKKLRQPAKEEDRIKEEVAVYIAETKVSITAQQDAPSNG